jgi:hypothetical protein
VSSSALGPGPAAARPFSGEAGEGEHLHVVGHRYVEVTTVTGGVAAAQAQQDVEHARVRPARDVCEVGNRKIRRAGGVRDNNQDFSALADRYLPHGAPSAVLDRLQGYRQAGVETVIFSPACSAERPADVVNAFAQAIRPTARSSAGVD